MGKSFVLKMRSRLIRCMHDFLVAILIAFASVKVFEDVVAVCFMARCFGVGIVLLLASTCYASRLVSIGALLQC